MRDVDTKSNSRRLDQRSRSPRPNQKPAWKPTDQPGIERNSEDGKLRNVNPTPSDKASPSALFQSV